MGMFSFLTQLRPFLVAIENEFNLVNQRFIKKFNEMSEVVDEMGNRINKLSRRVVEYTGTP
jgi:hypothetical protein